MTRGRTTRIMTRGYPKGQLVQKGFGRAAPWALALGGSLVLHACGLAWLGPASLRLPWGGPRAGAEPARPAWQLRWVSPPGQGQGQGSERAAPAAAGSAPLEFRSLAPARHPALQAEVPDAAAPPIAPAAGGQAQGAAGRNALDADPVQGSAAVRAQPPPPGVSRPVLSTRIPADFEQMLQVRRGGQSGHATWSWAVQQGRYRSELRAQWRGETKGQGAAAALDWASSGGLDSHGVAPDRFISRPAKGGARAVNFQRDSGIVSYSGPTGQAGLQPGAQDRLSWLVQLLAIAQAHPSGQGLPERLPLWVAGPQGDGADWWFEVQWHASHRCWQFTRRPERRYEVQVQAWLAMDAASAQAHLVHLEMGPEGSRQPPWQFWDAAHPGRCGHPP